MIVLLLALLLQPVPPPVVGIELGQPVLRRGEAVAGTLYVRSSEMGQRLLVSSSSNLVVETEAQGEVIARPGAAQVYPFRVTGLGCGTGTITARLLGRDGELVLERNLEVASPCRVQFPFVLGGTDG